MATPDHVDDSELLNKWFEADDYQDGKIASERFRSDELSVFRDSYKSVAELVAERGDIGVVQLTAAFVRSEKLEVNKAEPPDAHAHVVRPQGGRIGGGQAKRMRDEAMKHVVRWPTGLP